MPALRLPARCNCQAGSINRCARPSLAPCCTRSKCYLVQCLPSTFKDGYGATLDRKGACYDTNKGVVIKITDACPCNFPSNEVGGRGGGSAQ